jgi:hypothetical protein
VKRLVTVLSLVVFVVGLILSGLDDTDISLADTSVPDNQITSNQTHSGNSSASATITITMYTGDA